LVPPCIISASQRDKIIKLVQYVIALEVLPNLLPGVGIPLKKRSEYAHELLDQASASNVSDVEVNLHFYSIKILGRIVFL